MLNISISSPCYSAQPPSSAPSAANKSTLFSWLVVFHFRKVPKTATILCRLATVFRVVKIKPYMTLHSLHNSFGCIKFYTLPYPRPRSDTSPCLRIFFALFTRPVVFLSSLRIKSKPHIDLSSQPHRVYDQDKLFYIKQSFYKA